jgi:hypothetical protein
VEPEFFLPHASLKLFDVKGKKTLISITEKMKGKLKEGISPVVSTTNHVDGVIRLLTMM